MMEASIISVIGIGTDFMDNVIWYYSGMKGKVGEMRFLAGSGSLMKEKFNMRFRNVDEPYKTSFQNVDEQYKIPFQNVDDGV